MSIQCANAAWPVDELFFADDAGQQKAMRIHRMDSFARLRPGFTAVQSPGSETRGPLGPGWTFQEGREQIDRHREESGCVMLAGNFPHGLEEAELESDRLLADHGGRLNHL